MYSTTDGGGGGDGGCGGGCGIDECPLDVFNTLPSLMQYQHPTRAL